MTAKKTPTTAAKESEAETRLKEAQARVKVASDKHAAIVSVMSRLGVSPAERRLAQSESKKVERELQEATRMLREAEAAAGTSKVRTAS
jgi:hypothetical protein